MTINRDNRRYFILNLIVPINRVIFDINVPVAGSNKMPLIETFSGGREKTLWIFEHVDKVTGEIN